MKQSMCLGAFVIPDSGRNEFQLQALLLLRHATSRRHRRWHPSLAFGFLVDSFLQFNLHYPLASSAPEVSIMSHSNRESGHSEDRGKYRVSASRTIYHLQTKVVYMPHRSGPFVPPRARPVKLTHPLPTGFHCVPNSRVKSF